MESTVLNWIFFHIFILSVLALDLGLFHRQARVVKTKEALAWTIVWIVLALLFGGLIAITMGEQSAFEYFAGYLIEKSLSIDNIFVFSIIFSSFNVPSKYQHRILFWGILGALILRFVMILSGAALIARFHFVLYFFGAFLVYTGIKIFLLKDQPLQPKKHWAFKILNRYFSITPDFHGDSFRIKKGKQWFFTPLFVVLILIEVLDVVFAIDSIPAIFAITKDPFIVYTANVFAILGLRSMYFLLARAVEKFAYLKPALALILVLVGGKMLIEPYYAIDVQTSLGGVILILITAIILSLFHTKSTKRPL